MNFPIRPVLAAVAAFVCFVGARSAPIQDKFAGVPQALQAFVDHGEISGAVALVADRDRVLHLSAVGVSDLDTGRTMETGDIFWIA